MPLHRLARGLADAELVVLYIRGAAQNEPD
jgi:hypothetical protein